MRLSKTATTPRSVWVRIRRPKPCLKRKIASGSMYWLKGSSKLSDLGFKIFATSGTALELHSNYIAANVLRRINEDEPNITSYIKNKEIDLVINTPTKGRSQERDGFKIRRMAVEHSIPCFTTLDTAKVFVEIMLSGMADDKIQIYPMEVLV